MPGLLRNAAELQNGGVMKSRVCAPMVVHRRTQMENEKKYRMAVQCEVCGEPVRMIRSDRDSWTGECSDNNCRVVHQGAY